MTAFHYKAFKIEEDEETVTYNLCTDFFLDPNSFVKVILNKSDRSIENYDEIKELPEFSHSSKPLYWLQAKSTLDKVTFLDKLKHLA